MYHLRMKAPGSVSRRQLIEIVAGAAAAGVALPRTCTARALDTGSAWTPSAGLRLAGSVQGVATLDPALARDLDTHFLVRQVCRGLVGYDADLNPVPELAATVDASEDLREYRVSLRDDVRFHDGRAIEAEDVAWSFARALNPETAGGDPAGLAAAIYLRDIEGADDVLSGRASTLSGIAIEDRTTLRIALREPTASFPMKLAAVPAAVLDRTQATGDPMWWTSLNGSGPFRIASIDPATSLTLTPVERWRGEAISVASVSVLLGAGASQPENLYQAGLLDLVPDVLPQLVPLLEDPATGVEIGQLLDMPRFSLAYIAFGNQRPPLDDLHVRRAMQLAFPADRLAKAMFADEALPATGILPPGMLGQEWPANLPAHDLEAARVELAASRYGSAAEVPPISIYAADIVPVEALRDVAERDLGLRVEAIQVDWYDFLGGLAERRWDAYSLLWGADYPDPEAFLWVLFGSDSSENYTGYANPSVDALLAEARNDPGLSARRTRYASAQQALIDDVAVIPLFVPRGFTLARPGISRVPVTSMGLLGLETIR
jgi:ABC-type transport system substrate-binding protein